MYRITRRSTVGMSVSALQGVNALVLWKIRLQLHLNTNDQAGCQSLTCAIQGGHASAGGILSIAPLSAGRLNYNYAVLW